MSISSSARKYISLFLFSFVIIGIFVASFLGKKQDDTFKTNHAVYTLMTQQMQDSEYQNVLETAKVLDVSYQSTETVNYLIALAAINEGEIEQATLNMQRVLDINPYKVEDSMFMLQYAEILVQADKKDEALQVLERCEALPVPEVYPEYKERVLQLQEYLASTQL